MIDYSIYQLTEEDKRRLSDLRINMVFQPIFDAANLEIFAYEALMRPDGKTPVELLSEYQQKDSLDLIEVASCIGAAQEFVRRNYSQKLCFNSLPSEVLTAKQADAYYSSFPQLIGRVIVELVEHTLPNEEKWLAKKNFIESHGTQIALDDFSTGFNDHEAVGFFNPQYVKLDRTLISDIDKKPDEQESLRKLISEFHQQGIQVIAEGVETKEELEHLRFKSGVDFVQGYYLGIPQ